MLQADGKRTANRVKVFEMKEYPHGWCSYVVSHVGIEEFQNGVKLTITEFNKIFAELERSQTAQSEQLNQA